MPELPEVETIKRELNKSLKNRIISDVEVLWAKTVSPTTPNNFKKIIVGRKIINVERRAKMLIISLNNNISLLIHLKMTGQLIYQRQSSEILSRVGAHPVLREGLSAKNFTTLPLVIKNNHTRLIFSFEDGSKLYFNDLRKFGWVRIMDDKLKKYLETEIGIEPLSSKFAPANFKNILEKYPNRTVKQVLLDQKLIAGIGNIYADESAHMAGVLPFRKIKTLKENEVVALYKNIIAVLILSIQKKGTSSRNYLRSTGEPGGFVPHLLVYGRKDEKCKKCGSLILKIKHAGRGTHYCPVCQK